MATISGLLADHVSLRVRSVDRIFLAGYVPGLQSDGLLVRFLNARVGGTIPSLVILGKSQTNDVEHVVVGAATMSRIDGLPSPESDRFTASRWPRRISPIDEWPAALRKEIRHCLVVPGSSMTIAVWGKQSSRSARGESPRVCG